MNFIISNCILLIKDTLMLAEKKEEMNK